MIDNNYGTYSLICDICGEEHEEPFDYFDDAVEFKKDKDNGWKSKKINGQWQDVCPNCK